MMDAHLRHRNKPGSLAARISAAERQVSDRRSGVGVRAATLVRKIHRQMTAPASLLLAGGIGFVIGELTTRTPKVRGAAEHPGVHQATPLRTALNLFTSVRTLYAALPIAWMMKSYQKPDASVKARKRRSHRASAASGAGRERQGGR